jgi:hypothetical protein
MMVEDGKSDTLTDPGWLMGPGLVILIAIDVTATLQVATRLTYPKVNKLIPN